MSAFTQTIREMDSERCAVYLMDEVATQVSNVRNIIRDYANGDDVVEDLVTLAGDLEDAAFAADEMVKHEEDLRGELGLVRDAQADCPLMDPDEDSDLWLHVETTCDPLEVQREVDSVLVTLPAREADGERLITDLSFREVADLITSLQNSLPDYAREQYGV